jgi:DNA repair protein RecO (recombination protein O)
MSQNTPRDIKTLAYVLRRTNYGEADRILNVITPLGKKSVIAKAVRKEKSKLAGGVEMFSLVELNIHQGKSDMGTVTSARMIKYHANIVANLKRMELAAEILKKINLATEGTNAEGFFEIIKECLTELDDGTNMTLIWIWFAMNILKLSGEEINLYRDNKGEKLKAGVLYNWDPHERAFYQYESGEFDENDIKLLRLIVTSKLELVKRVKEIDNKLDKIVRLLGSVDKKISNVI